MESKYWDTATSASIDFSGTVYDLSAVTQGVADTNRIGDQLFPKSLELRMSMVAGDSTNLIRMLIIRYKMDTSITGGPPPTANVLQYTSATHTPLSPVHHDLRKTFDIIHDELFCLVQNASNGQMIVNRVFNLGRVPINFVAGATTGANKIFMVLYSDSGAAPNPGVLFDTRLNFVDA